MYYFTHTKYTEGSEYHSNFIFGFNDIHKGLKGFKTLINKENLLCYEVDYIVGNKHGYTMKIIKAFSNKELKHLLLLI